MKIRYCATYWGCEGMAGDHFLDVAREAGYEGVEINLPSGDFDRPDFRNKLETWRENDGFAFVAQQVLAGRRESPSEYIARMTERLELLAAFRPDFTNSHTGKDFFSFDDNCRAIEAAETVALKTGIPVYHEIHRGRFTFHLPGLLLYLDKFPEMKLTADFSHWCCVSESLLDDQQEALSRIFPHIRHLHARVGFPEGPQVGDPFASAFEDALSAHVNWWEEIIRQRKAAGDTTFTITTEAGPEPYMPLDGTRPVADNWEVNKRMMSFLKQTLSS